MKPTTSKDVFWILTLSPRLKLRFILVDFSIKIVLGFFFRVLRASGGLTFTSPTNG